MNESTQPAPQKPQIPDSVLTQLVKVLSTVVSPIQDPIYRFVIGISILVVILVFGVYMTAPDIPKPMYAALIAIGILALAAMIVGVISFFIQAGSPKRFTVDTSGEGHEMSKFAELRDWLDKLLDSEFRDMIRTLLTTKEQSHLPEPVKTIDRGAFLGAMQTLGRLDEVRQYLCDNYPDRFSC